MSTENLNKEESRKKLKNLAEDIKFAMMVTGFAKRPLNAVPMTTKKVDKEGNIWFLSPKDSAHNQNIEMNEEVQLLYSDPSDMEFLSVYGQAEITRDKSLIDDLYNSRTDNWFEGKDDPNITVIKITPQEAYYWDTKANKYITLLKIGMGAVTGKNQDVGVKGKMDL